ncbi:MAG: DUF559 domain-containing protein [Polyangiaceae bacterium]|nr:DUF559 domain-containing protein [Polyangiaceae bacterium]
MGQSPAPLPGREVSVNPLRRQQVLEARARLMRNAPTRSEAALWRLLSGGKAGASARRQVVLGNFIADFAVPAARLVIEVDGRCHARQRGRDARKDRQLARLGWHVLRLDADLVLSEPDEALAQVREALAAARG